METLRPQASLPALAASLDRQYSRRDSARIDRRYCAIDQRNGLGSIITYTIYLIKRIRTLTCCEVWVWSANRQWRGVVGGQTVAMC